MENKQPNFESKLKILDRVDKKINKLSKLVVRGAFTADGVSFLTPSCFLALAQILSYECITSIKLKNCKISAKKLNEMVHFAKDLQTLIFDDLQSVKLLSKSLLKLISNLPLKSLEISHTPIACWVFSKHLQHLKLKNAGNFDICELYDLITLSINDN